MFHRMNRNSEDDADDILIQRLIHYPSFPFSVNISDDNLQNFPHAKHIYDQLNDSIRLTIQKIGKPSQILVEIQNLIIQSFDNITYSRELKNFNLQFNNTSPEKSISVKKKRKSNNTLEIYEKNNIEDDNFDINFWISISKDMIQLLEIVLLSSQQCRHLFMGHHIEQTSTNKNSRLILKGYKIPSDTFIDQSDDIPFQMRNVQFTLFDHFIEAIQYYYQYSEPSLFKQIIDILNLSLVETLLYDKSPSSPMMNNAIKKTITLLLSPWFIDVFSQKHTDVKISCIELFSSLLDIQDNFNFEGNANLLLEISELFKVHDFKDKLSRIQLTIARLKSLRLLSKIMVSHTKSMLNILFPEKEVENQPEGIITSFDQDQRTHFLCRIVMMIADECDNIDIKNENELESLNVINESLQLLLLYHLNAQIGPILRYVGQLFWNVISKLNEWKRMDISYRCKEITVEIEHNLQELIKKISIHIPSLMSNVK